jgi:hypothetical protein
MGAGWKWLRIVFSGGVESPGSATAVLGWHYVNIYYVVGLQD